MRAVGDPSGKSVAVSRGVPAMASLKLLKPLLSVVGVLLLTLQGQIASEKRDDRVHAGAVGLEGDDTATALQASNAGEEYPPVRMDGNAGWNDGVAIEDGRKLRSDVSLKTRPPAIDLEEDKVALASKGGTFRLQAFVRDPEARLGDDRLEAVLGRWDRNRSRPKAQSVWPSMVSGLFCCRRYPDDSNASRSPI
jgi:hypothetical protein